MGTSQLYLYKISIEDYSYDMYDSAIVVAYDEWDAKTIHPWGLNYDLNDRRDVMQWTNDVSKINVTKVWVAENNLVRWVVLSSFNAG